MGQFKVYQEHPCDVTVVSNIFIDQYMKDANDAQLKIYLYLLRTMSAHIGTSVSDIADQFNHTEKDVIRSLKYWEKNHLISLEYDDSKALTGIRLLDVAPVQKAEKASPDTVSLAPVVPLPVKADPYEKPSYTLDQIREFKEKEETSQILFVVEQYVGKPLSPTEMKTILFFSDKLGFSEDLIDYLFQYCIEKGKKDFRYIEKVAISWAEEGITTPKQASRAAKKYDKAVYDIMKALGKTNAPTKAEADYALKWVREYGFTQDIILEACQRTVMATDKHRFEYADSIMNSWHKNQVHHKADIKALDDAYTQTRSSSKGSAKSSYGAAQFNQLMHGNYDFDALEKEILSN